MYRNGYANALTTVPRQIRLIAPLSLLPALLLVLGIPVIASIQNLYQTEVAILLDRLFCICGILLLTPLPQPEQDKTIKEVLASKKISPITVLAQRCLLSMVALMLFAVGLCGVIFLAGSTFPFWTFVGASTSTAFFLGSLGFVGSVISENWIVGYLLPVCYYFVCYGSGERYMGYFYLFALPNKGYTSKIILFITGLCIIAMAFCWQSVKAKKISAI